MLGRISEKVGEFIYAVRKALDGAAQKQSRQESVRRLSEDEREAALAYLDVQVNQYIIPRLRANAASNHPCPGCGSRKPFEIAGLSRMCSYREPDGRSGHYSWVQAMVPVTCSECRLVSFYNAVDLGIVDKRTGHLASPLPTPPSEPTPPAPSPDPASAPVSAPVQTQAPAPVQESQQEQAEAQKEDSHG